MEQDNKELIHYLRSKVLHQPSALPYNLNTNTRYQNYSTSLSWPYINDCLKKLFNNQTGGFFVEAGALNGQFLSNTLRLEKEQGWKGLLIEPEIYNFKDLMRKHRKAWTVNGCLSNTNYPHRVTLVSLKIRSELTGIHRLVIRGSGYQIQYEPDFNHSAAQSFYDSADSSYYSSLSRLDPFLTK